MYRQIGGNFYQCNRAHTLVLVSIIEKYCFVINYYWLTLWYMKFIWGKDGVWRARWPSCLSHEESAAATTVPRAVSSSLSSSSVSPGLSPRLASFSEGRKSVHGRLQLHSCYHLSVLNLAAVHEVDHAGREGGGGQ